MDQASVEHPKEVIKRAGGSEVGFSKVLKDKDHGEVDLRGERGHTLRGQDYIDEKGVVRKFVQLESGGLIAVPADSLKCKRRVFSLSHVAQSAWDAIFKRRNRDGNRQ